MVLTHKSAFCLFALSVFLFSFLSHAKAPDLPSDLEIRDTIDAWVLLNRDQQLVLQDMVMLLKQTLTATTDPSLPLSRLEQHFLALQHSRYCSRIYLYDTAQSSAWIYRAEQLVLSDPHWQSVLRDFNRKSLGFIRPRPDPSGCL